jgi:hypothetical protein
MVFAAEGLVMTTHFELVERIGVLLHGDFWQHKLAADLNISDRAFRVWRKGRSPVPAGIWENLASLLMMRGCDLLEIAQTARHEAAKESELKIATGAGDDPAL